MLHIQSYAEKSGDHDASQDAFEVVVHPCDEGYTVCVLADGQGGRAGGERAAQLACATVIKSASKVEAEELLDPTIWVRLLKQADQIVSQDADAGFTTLVGFCVASPMVVGASNGDSAAVLIQGDDQVQLTGQQRKNPPIGSGLAAVTPFVQSLRGQWKLLVMSDGVWKYAGWPTVIKHARDTSGESLFQRLREAAALPATNELQDDFTLVSLTPDQPAGP